MFFSVKRFERSHGPDIALYINYLYLFTFHRHSEVLRVARHTGRWSIHFPLRVFFTRKRALSLLIANDLSSLGNVLS